MGRNFTIFATKDEYAAAIKDVCSANQFRLWHDMPHRGGKLKPVRSLASRSGKLTWIGPDLDRNRVWTANDLCVEYGFACLVPPVFDEDTQELVTSEVFAVNGFQGSPNAFVEVKKALDKFSMGKVHAVSESDPSNKSATNFRISRGAMVQWQREVTLRQVLGAPVYFCPEIDDDDGRC